MTERIDTSYRLGYTLTWKDTLLATVSKSYHGCCQVCNVPLMEIQDKQDTLRYIQRYDIHMYVHAPMNTNLASTSSWGHTIHTYQTDWINWRGFPIGYVVHVGKVGSLALVKQRLKSMIIPDNVTIYLENAAGQGSELGTTMSEMRECLAVRPGLKLCLDTQHSFASGLCSFRTKEDVDQWLSYEPDLIHLNDSMVAFGKRVDRHAGLGEGKIWEDDTTTLNYLLDKSKGIDLILETPEAKEDWDKFMRIK